MADGFVVCLNRPRRREAADGQSISRFFRLLSPFPFAGLPVVARDVALDHFVAPFVACHNERGEIAAAKAKRAKARHNDELQRFTHRSPPLPAAACESLTPAIYRCLVLH
jgi:hypothetical protein